MEHPQTESERDLERSRDELEERLERLDDHIDDAKEELEDRREDAASPGEQVAGKSEDESPGAQRQGRLVAAWWPDGVTRIPRRVGRSVGP